MCAGNMKTIETRAAMQADTQRAVGEGRCVVLVPTMGYLHEGHLSLIRLARTEANAHVVVSLFVNPTQFGPGEDFGRYPRNMDRDQRVCVEEKVDVLFCPAAEEMYASDHSVYLQEEKVSASLEGKHRPGHFSGVLTVVAKLFLAVQPTVAVFGQKDAQQLWLIRKMVRDLNFPVCIHAGPTVREPDGLALSSRNIYLEGGLREQAAGLSRALRHAVTLHGEGEKKSAVLRQAAIDSLQGFPDLQLDYIEIVDEETFAPVPLTHGRCRILIAARVGTTRLIDNMELVEGGGVHGATPDFFPTSCTCSGSQ